MDDQEEAQSSEPGATPGTPPAAPKAPPKKKAGLSKGAVATLIIGVIVVVAVTFYAGEIKWCMKLQPWNKAAPCAVVNRFQEALKNGDVPTAKELLGGERATVNVEGTRITAVKPAESAPQMPPVDASKVIIAGKASSGQVKFEIAAVRGSASITAKSEQGKDVTFVLTKSKEGQWYLIQVVAAL